MYKATYLYGDTVSTYTGSADYVLGVAMVSERYYAKTLDTLERTGYAEWGWWNFERINPKEVG